jgi:hypothetical protein
MVNSLSGKDWIPKWEAKVVMATVTKAQTMGVNKALILCVSGGKNCDAEMGRQPQLVRAIKQEMADQSFRVRVEWMDVEDFYERWPATKGTIPRAPPNLLTGRQNVESKQPKQQGAQRSDVPQATASQPKAEAKKQKAEAKPKAEAHSKQKVTSAQPKAVALCKYFAKGKCVNGDACTFSHRSDKEGRDTNSAACGQAKQIQCLECGKSFKTWEQIEAKHWLCKGHAPMCKCVQCGKAFDIGAQCQQHQKDTGHKGMARVNHPAPATWICRQCSKLFNTETALDQHKTSAGHNTVPACKGCDRVFDTFQALSQHQAAKGHTGVEWLDESDLESDPESDAEVHVCVCNRVFSSRPALEQHMSATGHRGATSSARSVVAQMFSPEVHVCSCGLSFPSERAAEKHSAKELHYNCSYVNMTVPEAVQHLQNAVRGLPPRRPPPAASPFPVADSWFDNGVRDLW